MGDSQFNGTQEEWDALVKKNKSKTMTAVEWLENELKKIPFINPKEAFEQAKQMEGEQTEISDEEIEKAIIDQDVVKQEGYCHCFLEGAKWYREQLKNK